MANDPVLKLAADISWLNDELDSAFVARDVEAQDRAIEALRCVGAQLMTAEPTTYRGVGAKLKDALATLNAYDDSVSLHCRAALERIVGRFSRGKPSPRDIVSLRAALSAGGLAEGERL